VVLPVKHFLLAEAAHRSYDNHTLVDNEIEVLIEDVPEGLLVAFRGTEANRFFSGNGWVDILRDLRIIPWYDRRVGWHHAGFLKGAQLICDGYGLRTALRGPVYVTGHSLGGALALAAGGLLKASGCDVKQVVTFGAPKGIIGSPKIFKDIAITQYMYGNDIVPSLPFWWYRHWNVVHIGPQELKAPAQWSDHSIGLYIKELRWLDQ
jgi:hypothetical protein